MLHNVLRTDDIDLHSSVKRLSFLTMREVVQRPRASRRGQTMVEYVIVAGILVTTVAIMAVFLYTFKQFGGRVLDLVASEYP